MTRDLPWSLFKIKNNEQFRSAALEVFGFQVDNNQVYREFLDNLGRDRSIIKGVCSIPFLPVELFKSRKILSGDLAFDTIFESSRTSGDLPSRHYVHDIKLYERSFTEAFRMFAGNPSEYLITALLPSYVERDNSSLVYMMNRLIRESTDAGSGFYRNDQGKLVKVLEKAKKEGKKILLFGVSFALLDLAEKYSPDLSGAIVMETGGMKGRRKEIIRQELHSVLKQQFNVEKIYSEYGMTELLSQAYSSGDGIFHCPPWMKILIRDPQDPLTVSDEPGMTGGINIIDLANYYSCSFLATGDLGRLHEDGGFEIIGRFDHSDIRGCNLMAGQ